MKLERHGRRPAAVRVRDALGRATADRILRATWAERRWLVDASTGGRDEHRRAQLLYTPVDEAHEVAAWVEAALGQLCDGLGVERFVPRRRELQITVHGDGDFYKAHTDDQGPDVAPRALSFLYYVHRTPKPFEGGELVIHDDERVELAPIHDSIVVFPSALEHEVRPVRVPSGELADGRFTVNGWLWR